MVQAGCEKPHSLEKRPTGCKRHGKQKNKVKERSIDQIPIDWVRSGWTGKYLAFGNTLRSVRTPWPRVKYFPVWPSCSVNKSIIMFQYVFFNSWQSISIVILYIKRERRKSGLPPWGWTSSYMHGMLQVLKNEIRLTVFEGLTTSSLFFLSSINFHWSTTTSLLDQKLSLNRAQLILQLP